MSTSPHPRAVEHHPGGTWPVSERSDWLTLDYDQRHRRRIVLTCDGGLQLLLDLPRAVAMAEGDGLRLEDGRWVEIAAAPEPVMLIHAASPHALARIAWHVGNRHLPAMIKSDHLVIRPDHVIKSMVEGLGATVSDAVGPFQPEGGAYGGSPGHGGGHGHHHGHAPDHSHDHGHD